VRDGIFFVNAGHPTVVFVHDVFEHAARTQARALGMPDLKIFVFPQHKAGDQDAEETAKGIQAAHEFPRLLVAGK
jgi:hypothetical protein